MLLMLLFVSVIFITSCLCVFVCCLYLVYFFYVPVLSLAAVVPTCKAQRIRILILVNNQLDAQNLLYNKFISSLYMSRAPCAHRQGVKIVLYSLWYLYTETSEWSKFAKIAKITDIYNYEHIVVILCVCV